MYCALFILVSLRLGAIHRVRSQERGAGGVGGGGGRGEGSKPMRSLMYKKNCAQGEDWIVPVSIVAICF